MSAEKYSFEKVEDHKFYVWHTEEFKGKETKILIAITDTAEKAHFLATSANEYKESTEDTTEDVEALAEEVLDKYNVSTSWDGVKGPVPINYGHSAYGVAISALVEMYNKGAAQSTPKEAPQVAVGEWENQLKEALGSMETVEDVIYFIKQYFTETNGYDALLKEHYELANSQVAVECYEKLIEAQDRYIGFLSNAFNQVYSIAHVHQYRSSGEEIEKGQRLRDQIEQLKKTILYTTK